MPFVVDGNGNTPEMPDRRRAPYPCSLMHDTIRQVPRMRSRKRARKTQAGLAEA